MANGFFSLGQAIAGGDPRGAEDARLEGLALGTRINAQRASTENALAQARLRRDKAIARRKLSEMLSPELAGLVQADVDPRQVTGARLDQQELGFRDTIADFEQPFNVRQSSAQAVHGQPLSASDLLGPGGELFLDPNASSLTADTFRPTATGSAQIDFDTQRARLAEEKRLHPDRFKSGITINTAGQQPLGDAILEDIGDTTIPDIDPAQATGIGGAAKSFANIPFDMVNANLPFPDTSTAENALQDLSNRVQIVGQQAVPGRPSVKLMDMLATFGVEPNTITRGDQRSLDRLTQTSRFLGGEIDRIRRQINAGRLTPSKLVEFEEGLRNLAGLKRDIDVVLSRFNASDPQKTASGGSFVVEDLP